MLKGYIDWLYAEQVLRIVRRRVRIRDGQVEEETTYGLTSMTAAEAGAAQLLSYVRQHWGIENGPHYRRDETFRGDRCRVTGQGARPIAVISNLVLGLLRRRGMSDVPDARRHYDANLEEAVELPLFSPA